MDTIEKRKKYLRDSDRYKLKKGIIKLEDVCFFCGGSGCDETHHDSYAEPPVRKRCHKKCHVVYHNRKKSVKNNSIALRFFFLGSAYSVPDIVGKRPEADDCPHSRQ